MANWWDRETTQLRRRIDELEKQNEKLRGMLSDAVVICDLALAQDKIRRKALEKWEQLSASAALADNDKSPSLQASLDDRCEPQRTD